LRRVNERLLRATSEFKRKLLSCQQELKGIEPAFDKGDEVMRNLINPDSWEVCLQPYEELVESIWDSNVNHAHGATSADNSEGASDNLADQLIRPYNVQPNLNGTDDGREVRTKLRIERKRKRSPIHAVSMTVDEILAQFESENELE